MKCKHKYENGQRCINDALNDGYCFIPEHKSTKEDNLTIQRPPSSFGVLANATIGLAGLIVTLLIWNWQCNNNNNKGSEPIEISSSDFKDAKIENEVHLLKAISSFFQPMRNQVDYFRIFDYDKLIKKNTERAIFYYDVAFTGKGRKYDEMKGGKAIHTFSFNGGRPKIFTNEEWSSFDLQIMIGTDLWAKRRNQLEMWIDSPFVEDDLKKVLQEFYKIDTYNVKVYGENISSQARNFQQMNRMRSKPSWF